MEKANEYHLDLHLAFVNYKKAFNSVEMWEIEKCINKGITYSRYRLIIQNIYKLVNMNNIITRNYKTYTYLVDDTRLNKKQ